MRILVTGSRDWEDVVTVWKAIMDAARVGLYCNVLEPGITLVHGHCPTGADALADEFVSRGRDRGEPWSIERHPADWEKYGKRAGYLRNKEMVDLGADVCLAFVKNNSKGATMTLKMARAAGIPTWVYRA